MKKNHAFFLKRSIKVIIFGVILLPAFFGYSTESPSTSNSSDWHQWRGPNRDGVSPQLGISKSWPKQGPEIRWRVPVGEGYSGISAAGGKLFTMWDEGNAEFLFCLDAQSGKKLWKYKVGKNFLDE